MDRICHHANVLEPSFVNGLRARADETFQQIYTDYFAEKDYPTFLNEHMHKEGVVAKVASWRFASSEVLNHVKMKLTKVAQGCFEDDEYMLHPIYYLRLSAPDFFQSEKQRNAFLDSQPHYDRIFGIKAYTFWLAIEQADEATGVLCSFNNPAVEEYFYRPWPEKNRYNYDLYLDAANEVDPMVRGQVYAPEVKVGDVLSFPWTVLHGATRPTTKRRLSFDFRLFTKSQFEGLEPHVQKIILGLERSVDLCNANNLMLIGDPKGAARIYRDIAKQQNNMLMEELADALDAKDPDAKLLAPLANNSWRGEYKWLYQ